MRLSIPLCTGAILKKKLLTISVAAERIGTNVTTFRKILNSKNPPPHIRISQKTILIPEASLDSWLEESLMK